MEVSGAFAAFTSTYGVLSIFVVMLLKESGVPLPVPSDLLMIAAGIQIAAGTYSPVELLIALVLAVFIGGSIQFALARTAGRAVVYRLASIVGIGAERLDRAVARLSSGGSRAVFVGLNIPGARAAVIPAAGLARLAFVPFTIATITGSIVFYGWHVALGYAVGPAAATLFERNAAAILVLVVVLPVAGLALWVLLQRRAHLSDRGAVRSWTEASCPACLAVTALRTSEVTR